MTKKILYVVKKAAFNVICGETRALHKESTREENGCTGMGMLKWMMGKTMRMRIDTIREMAMRWRLRGNGRMDDYVVRRACNWRVGDPEEDRSGGRGTASARTRGRKDLVRRNEGQERVEVVSVDSVQRPQNWDKLKKRE